MPSDDKLCSSPIGKCLSDLKDATNRSESLDWGADPKLRKNAQSEIEGIAKSLAALAAKLDPVIRPASVFDPTEPNTAGRIVALTLVAQQRNSLKELPEFYGAGVYAIYYKGDFAPYKPLSGIEHPIYVGKADPEDPSAKEPVAQGKKLFGRLNDHRKNIEKASSSLRIEDFDCRFLVVQTGFQKSAEDYLINFFKPIWNSEQKIAFGLGKHGDSSTTRGNKRSPWDTLHPGRTWAESTTEDQKPKDAILKEINAHFAAYPPYASIQQIFQKFMDDIRQIRPS